MYSSVESPRTEKECQKTLFSFKSPHLAKSKIYTILTLSFIPSKTWQEQKIRISNRFSLLEAEKDSHQKAPEKSEKSLFFSLHMKSLPFQRNVNSHRPLSILSTKRDRGRSSCAFDALPVLVLKEHTWFHEISLFPASPVSRTGLLLFFSHFGRK